MSSSHKPAITPNVSFDVVAREIRCKWSDVDDKASLSGAQTVLETHLAALKGFGDVRRVVCGDCQDFKIITSCSSEKFGAFAESGFGPEAQIIAALKEVKGVESIETQTYTFMSL